MVFRLKISIILVLVCYLMQGVLLGEDTETNVSRATVEINAGVDLFSRYVWRGTDFGDSPSIQPFVSFSFGNFEIGSWSAVSTTNCFKEFDLYAKASFSDFYAIVTDYYIPQLDGMPLSPDGRYFVYGDTSTSHTFEASLGYKSPGKYPFWIQANMFFYGNDKRWGYNTQKDAEQETYYSSYIEAGYTFGLYKYSADLFAGFTPAAGAYGSKAGLVNLGLTVSREIEITEKFSLPLKTSLIFNPQTSSAWFVVGITLAQ